MKEQATSDPPNLALITLDNIIPTCQGSENTNAKGRECMHTRGYPSQEHKG